MQRMDKYFLEALSDITLVFLVHPLNSAGFVAVPQQKLCGI